MKLTKLYLALLSPILAAAITIQEVPQCAQNCLANSTQSQTNCQVINIACLCADPTYVSALSCCLATQCNSDEQAKAIEFNQQECNNVNETAPNFVGCAPSNLASSVFLGSSTQASTFATSTVLFSTVSGIVVSQPATFTGAAITASFDGRPLMTGSCSQPFFAMVTAAPKSMTEFPEIGCSPYRNDCCPFPYGANGVITRCPQDYFTTAGGCCPLGYQVYYTSIGPQMPCYSVPSNTLIPATLTTDSRLTLITDHVFAQKYMLTATMAPSGPKSLSSGALAGIGVGAAAVFFGLIGALWFWRRRQEKKLAEPQRGTTFPPVEPTLPMSQASQPPQSPQELASPEQQGMSPRSPRVNIWPMALTSSPPPGYHMAKGRSESTKGIPQELPGSTYIHEHHPAFTTHEPPSPTSPATPRTPTRSFTGGSESGSPMVTPSSTAPAHAPRSPPGVVSPLNSPKLPPGRLT